MSEPALRLVGHNLLDHIKRSIVEGHERLSKGHADWVEGSLQIAMAMREGRDLVPANISFSKWLKVNDLDFFDKDERAALLNLATNQELAREIFSNTDSRSYIVIWRQAKMRFRTFSKTTRKKSTKSRKSRTSIVKDNRAIKLGEDTVAKLEGTTLESAEEQNELVVLNRGVAEGEQHTKVVAQLVSDAVAGKEVSAIATGAKLAGFAPLPTNQLIDVFRRRLLGAWLRADTKAREAAIEYLMERIEETKEGNVHE